MKSRAGSLCLATALSFLSSAVESHAAGVESADPCDFESSGRSVFPYAQVMACFEQIPFSRGDLQGIVDVIRQARSFSDLSEIYDQRVEWRGALAALAGQNFANDWAMHSALLAEHKRFRNLHVAYWPPGCYWRMVTAFLPLDFGSVVRGTGRRAEQLIFIESASAVAPQYLEATGIDATTLVGQRVVSINGVPVLDYFRDYVEQVKTHEDAGGGLNGVLNGAEYSVRFAAQRAFLPDRPADTFVLESIDGTRTALELPWLFALTSSFLGARGYAPTSSSEAFHALCQEGPSPLQGFSIEPTHAGLVVAPDVGLDPVFRSRWRNAPAAPGASSYFELPPERLGQDIVEVIPRTSGARVLQYNADVTVLQLGNTTGWIDVARRGIEHACQNSSRLIVDVRNNSGGNDTTIRWLHHHLLPEDGQLTAAGMLALRVRNDDPLLNQLLFNEALYSADYLPPIDPSALACDPLLQPVCLLDTRTGTALPQDDLDWFRNPSRRERRGGELLSVSRKFSLHTEQSTVFDTASCAGRFSGADLVFITNGTNASGGYFLPAAFQNQAVLVNTGGFLGEPMAMGRARGGASQAASDWAAKARELELASAGEVPFPADLLEFSRPVDSTMEMLGAYRKDGTRLHVEAPVGADLHVDVWTTLAGSEGFVYEKVLAAVDARR